MSLRLCQLIWLTVMIATPALSASTTKPDWTLKKDKDGIQVYTRPDPGSPLDEFKGTVELTARLSSLVKLIRDTNHAEEWMHSSGGIEVIKTINPQQQIIRNITLSPWPVSNRDVILKTFYYQDPETRIVTFELHSLQNYTPERAGFVRIPRLEGKWTFKPLTQGIVQVSYQLKMDPGGSIPGWLARSTSLDIPFTTLRKMRETLENPIYATAILSDVTEP